MVYDEARAATYDAAHPSRFDEADVVADALLALSPDGRVLELGVGTGRLAIPLAARGADVWGIDNSPPMLERLRAKPGGQAVHTVEGDFADVAALVGNSRFDLVFVAFNTLFELRSQDEQVRTIVGAAGVLSEQGVLVAEAIAPDLTRLEQTLTALSVTEDAAVLQATRHDPATQLVAGANVTVGATGQVRLDPWTIRYVSVPELDLMARLAGLRLRDRWGGWHREPFTAASAVHVSVYGR